MPPKPCEETIMHASVPDPIVSKLFRGPPKPVRTAWAAVADGRNARFFERRGGMWSELVQLGFEVEYPSSDEWSRDRPGRVHESAGPARHAIEPHHDPREEAKKSVAGRVAAELEDAASADRFDIVFLVAPPRFLGYLRAALGPATRRKVAGALSKDLVDAPLDEILEQLNKHAGGPSV